MRLGTLLPAAIRSRYALKLLCISVLVVCVITALAGTTVVQVSGRVKEEQLRSVETNAELEARALGQWIDGKQQTVRVLSSHDGFTPLPDDRTGTTLEAELEALSNETATLSIVERRPNSYSNGTRETIVASTDSVYYKSLPAHGLACRPRELPPGDPAGYR